MDNVNKPHNLAAIIRSCDAVGIHEVHAISSRTAIRTKQHAAAGASKWVRVRLEESITPVFEDLGKKGYRILVAACGPDAVDFRTLDYTVPTAIVVGAELTGPSEETMGRADHFIGIPMEGMVESLNVSVAAAVILFEAQRQRLLAGMYGRNRFPQDTFERLLFESAYPRLSRHLKEQEMPYPALDADGAILSVLFPAD
jgi:tRNA (guanosine-2'-O-)-methyltransferase